LCLHLNKVTRNDEFRERVQEERLLYSSDRTTDAHQLLYDATGDICICWQNVSDSSNGVGGKKYEHLTCVVKAALTFAHSNAVPERCFSINNSMLGKESLLLGEKTIVALRLVKDIIKLYGGATKVPINKDTVLAARKAHSEYAQHLEEERRLKALEEDRRKQEEIKAQEEKLVEKQKDVVIRQLSAEEKKLEEQNKEHEVAVELISEANKKLLIAVKTIICCRLKQLR
jgi:hypothetical protein